MSVSGQAQVAAQGAKGPRARMRRTMLDTALKLMEKGIIPSVSEVAEAAEVSRATAYRYFPSQAKMIQAAVDEALGPILGWTSDSPDAEQRIVDLLTFSYPRMETYEATHRGALWLALDQWARRQAGTLGTEAPIVRGNRRALLRAALAPLRGQLDRQATDKLAQALSLLFGIETIVVLRDIWGLEREQTQEVVIWAAQSLVRAALADAATTKAAAKPERQSMTRKKQAAKRPRRKES